MRKAIILAAGRGTRMKSDQFKVLHKVANREMLLHILDSVKSLNVDDIRVVLSPAMDTVAQKVAPVKTAIQPQAMGTAHAAMCGAEQMCPFDGACLILFGDHPLYYASTFEKMMQKCESGTDIVVLGFQPKDPARYGRLIMGNDGLQAIIEYKDATEEQRAINMCNSGAMCVNGTHLLDLLREIKNENAAGEYYLTDIVKLARAHGLKVDVEIADEKEVLGVNSRAELAVAEENFQNRMRQKAFEAGVTMIDPKTVYFSYDTTFENDILIEPCVVFGTGVSLKKGAYVKAFSRFENQEVK